MTGPRRKICVCTSNPAAAEPRAPRHATALEQAGYEVCFIDAAPCGVPASASDRDLGVAVTHRRTLRFPYRGGCPLRWMLRRASQQLQRALFRVRGHLSVGLLSGRVSSLERCLVQERADLYFAHNIDTLLPAFRAAQRCRALLVFDCMEYYSAMGEGQSALEARIAAAIERACLPGCALLTASSREVAAEYRKAYGATRTLAIYNKPPRSGPHEKPATNGLRLYWRNAVLGLGQRGLDEALQAMTRLPADVVLCLQGRLPTDGGRALRARIEALGLQGRVQIKPPFAPGEAVKEAALHDVGLCLERGGIRNHELTVSNKLFDYMMAGLAVVVSDLPGLAAVVREAGVGGLFRPGDVESLASVVKDLYMDRDRLAEQSARARAYALETGNAELEMQALTGAIAKLLATAPETRNPVAR